MEYLLILLIFVLFALPGILLSRSNRKRVEKARAVQSAAKAGDRIITVSGFHGTIVSAGETTVELELAPGTVVTMEREGVYKVIENDEADAGATGVVDESGATGPAGSTVRDTGADPVDGER
ncbi:preprotein translocase subunit YajC [Corynebacterium appendicis]|uniref:preprotein translocase subunit YajC n=1 Tax=Corynebacterium appendicis TaxID=163202 RepID=UPI0021AF67AE|nr:preprotein translocase subunit YajC [Corynebacterium appendicis]MCT1684347.1 preprotein translocase subunit YajC [Corynebacterium appendicis]MDK8625146.1 preprotein translocase subunit YajC [Corynebacterium appendicis]